MLIKLFHKSKCNNHWGICKKWGTLFHAIYLISRTYKEGLWGVLTPHTPYVEWNTYMLWSGSVRSIRPGQKVALEEELNGASFGAFRTGVRSNDRFAGVVMSKLRGLTCHSTEGPVKGLNFDKPRFCRGFQRFSDILAKYSLPSKKGINKHYCLSMYN